MVLPMLKSFGTVNAQPLATKGNITMKLFTNDDVKAHTCVPDAGKIITENNSDLVFEPLNWQKRGLQQTASGYGRKLNSGFKINFNGKMYRIYVTQFSNAASFWFISKGRKIFVH